MKCKYCDKPAKMKVTPAKGGPVVDVCADHARLAKKAVDSAKAGKIVKKPEGGFTPGKKGVNPFAKQT